MSDRTSAALLVAGYAAAVPFTAWTPGFLRLWRRRERWVLATAQGGALLVAVGWAVRGNVPAAVINTAWVAGLGAAYAVQGRRRLADRPRRPR